MSRAKLGDGATVGRTFKLPEELDRRLAARAIVTGIPMGQIIRYALAEYLRQFEK